MSVNAAVPESFWGSEGAVLTFVIPAPNGCNLACPFCYIVQRLENNTTVDLMPAEYARFIREAIAVSKVASVCIQGYEPLLPESFSYTQAILSTCRWLGIPSAMVTNGTYLAEHVDALRTLGVNRLSVSLDAATAAEHDRQRGKIGAFESTVTGLKAAVGKLGQRTQLGVNSVLMPKRSTQLDGMPELLANIGVKRWTVTILQNIRKNEAGGGPVGEPKQIFDDLRQLRNTAERHGLVFAVDDEFSGLDDKAMLSETLRVNRLIQPEGVYRLVPDGRCSKGADILKPLTDDTPRWDPKTMDAGEFLQSL